MALKKPYIIDQIDTIKSDLADIAVNVKSAPYNAKGDGVTDDTAAFNNAFAYAFANNLDINIPEGNYSVSYIRATARAGGIDINIFGNGKILLNDSNTNKGIILTGTNASKIKITEIIIKGQDIYNITFPLRLLTWETAIVDGITVDTFQHNGITAGEGNIIQIKNCTVLNCGDIRAVATPASADYINDGVYIHNAVTALIENNYIVNDISANTTYNYGRCGIVCEYDVQSIVIRNNYVSGYSRGIHSELNKLGINEIIENNRVIGNCTGILIWNNQTGVLTIRNNYISNAGALKTKSAVNKWCVDSAATYGYAILFLGNTNDYKTIIKDNVCKGVYDTSLILQMGLLMSSGQSITDELGSTIFKNKEWFVIENNLFDCGIKGINEMTEGNIPILPYTETMYFINSTVRNNVFNCLGTINVYMASTFSNTLIEENTFVANGTSGAISLLGIAISKVGIYATIPNMLYEISFKNNAFISKTSSNIGFTLNSQQNSELLTFSNNRILNYGVSATKQPMFYSTSNNMINKTMGGNTIFENNELRVVGAYASHPNSYPHSQGFSSEYPSVIILLNTSLSETGRSKIYGYNKKYNKKFTPSKTSVYTIGYFYLYDVIDTFDGNRGYCTTEGYYTQKQWTSVTSMSNSYNNNNPLVYYGSRCFLCTTSGTTGGTVPAEFSTANVGDSITDNTVVWKYMGALGAVTWHV